MILCTKPTIFRHNVKDAMGNYRGGTGSEKLLEIMKRKDRHRPALGIWRDPQMVEKLELTAEQVKQVRNKGKLKRSAIENVSEIERHDADR